MKIHYNEIGDVKPWHSWFAWHPVYVGSHDIRWLEYVWRKGTFVFGYGDPYWKWEYKIEVK